MKNLNQKPLTRFLLLYAILGIIISTSLRAEENTLIFCPAAGPEGFNPQLYAKSSTFDASSRVLYDRLLAFQPGTTQVIPALAQSWEISNRGRVYTFKLRPNVRFHGSRLFQPGRTFNADDVVFSFERQWRSDHPYHKVSGTDYPGFAGMRMKHLLAAIDKLDDQTVRFTLKHPDASFPAVLAMDFASILSAEYAGQLAAAQTPQLLDIHPIGTGPFRLLDYEPDKQILYQAHESYWRGRPAINHLVFTITPDSDERWARLKAGDCHILPPLALNEMGRIKKQHGVRLLQKTAFDVGYLAFNVKQAPFDNRTVRRALTFAVNKQAIIDTVYQPAGRLATTPLLLETQFDDATTQEAYSYDPVKARRLLHEAGLADGFSTNLWYMPIARYYHPDARRVAQMIRDDWAAVGVDAQLISYDWPEFLRRSRNGEHASILLGWTGDNGDPDNFLSAVLGCDAVGGGNRAQWCDPSFEELLRQARVSIEPATRLELYKQAQWLFLNEAPWIPLAHSIRFQPIRREVQGFVMDVFGASYFHSVTLTR
jgi:dipeptide transport system substrate-binding protein